MIRHFCTLFDRNYLLKGIAMLQSLQRYCPSAHISVLCMDELTLTIMKALNFSNVACISLAQIEDEQLLAVKSGRSMAEYCWTLSPCLPWYVLQQNPQIDFITYLDADLYFYSSLEPLFDEIGNASIVVIEHRYTPNLKHLEINGRFCVEWVSFRRDENGLACLNRWREQCIEWCFYRFEEDRMGDQKYLDKWPNLYRGVHILEHKGAGIAPWNYAQYCFTNDLKNRIMVDGAPLIFYHFHQFQMLSDGNFDRLSKSYNGRSPEPASVYDAYEQVLVQVLRDIRRGWPDFSFGLKPVLYVKSQRLVQYLIPRSLKQFLKKFIKAV